MTIKMLLEVDVDEDQLYTYGPRPSQRQVAEDVASRLALNEVGNGNFRMVKVVKGKLVAYGPAF